MKILHLFVLLGTVLSLGAATTAPVTPTATAQGSHESVELTVLKVFSAKDGEAIFRAYLVEWKGQEVIVDDTLAKTNYQAGEKATVLVMKSPFPNQAEAYDLLHFQVLPKRK